MKRNVDPSLPRWFQVKAFLVALLVCVATGASAALITIQPTDTLRISFTTLAAPDCQVGPCDTLIFNLAIADNPNAASITTAELFNSATLLGTYQTDISCLQSGECPALVPSFRTSTSIFGLHSVVIDFTSILDGTIDGVLDIRFNRPIDFDIEPTSFWNFLAITHATERGTGIGGYFRHYDSVSVAPEPTSLALLGVGLATLIASRRRQRVEPR